MLCCSHIPANGARCLITYRRQAKVAHPHSSATVFSRLMKAISFPREGLLSTGIIRLQDGQEMHGPMRSEHGPIIKSLSPRSFGISPRPSKSKTRRMRTKHFGIDYSCTKRINQLHPSHRNQSAQQISKNSSMRTF